jgi:hypothetical protein
MAHFLAFRLIPILAALWIGGGSLALAMEVISGARAVIQRKPIRTEVNLTLAGFGLVFVVTGLVFTILSRQQDRGPQLVLLLFGGVSLLGASAPLITLWVDRRRRS